MRRIVRAAAVVAAVISLLAWAHAIASASEVEYCPARVLVERVGTATPEPSASPQPATMFAVRLDAASARSVRGVVGFATSDGWYQVPIPETALAATQEQWRDTTVEFKRLGFVSRPLFVSFPKPVTIASSYMMSASTVGESVFGWDTKGTVECSPSTDGRKGPKQWHPAFGREPLHQISPTFGLEPPPVSAAEIHAATIASVPDTTCAVPFADARVSEIVTPAYPYSLRDSGIQFAQTIVAVAVSATGKLDDAWIFAPSGYTPFDLSALTAVRRSSYEPARAFCQNVPGIYLFVSDFKR